MGARSPGARGTRTARLFWDRNVRFCCHFCVVLVRVINSAYLFDAPAEHFFNSGSRDRNVRFSPPICVSRLAADPLSPLGYFVPLEPSERHQVLSPAKANSSSRFLTALRSSSFSARFLSAFLLKGAVGDCWFLAGLAVISERPDLIGRVVGGNGPLADTSGCFEVNLFKDGRWER